MIFNRDHDFSYGVEEAIAPGLIRITAQNPGALTFQGTGTYILGSERSVVIDPGPRLQTHADVLTACVAAGNPEHILLTHRHQDHAGLAAALSSATGMQTAAFTPRVLKRTENLKGETVDSGFHPDNHLRDGDVIEGPGFRLTAIHTPGHTGDHLCFVDSINRRVYCGDHIMAWSTTVILPPDGHIGHYLESLEKLLRFDDHVFWPTHGPPIENPAPWIKQLIEHRKKRQQQIVMTLSDGPANATTLVTRIYPDLGPTLTRAAHQSLLAGLNWLIEQGKVTQDDNGAEDTYRLT